MGLGMQRWIYTQKTRKLFQKRSKPDSGGNASMNDVYNELLKSKAKYRKFVDHKNLTPEYKKLLIKKMWMEQKVARQRSVIIVLLSILTLAPIAYFFYELNKEPEKSKVRKIVKEVFTPAGKVNTIIWIDENSDEIISVEQQLNDSVIYKEQF